MPELTAKNFAVRRGRVGASGVAALVEGVGHPFVKPADIYANVVHGLNTFRGSSNAAEMGHALEDTVLTIGTQKTGIKVRRNSITRAHPTLPLAVTCDAFVAGSKGRIPVEVKTASGWMADEWADGNVPAHYIVQVHAQMMVQNPRGVADGTAYAYIWALVGGRDFHAVRVDVDQDLVARIERGIEEFWSNHIEPRVPPEDTDAGLLLSFDIPEDAAAAEGELETVGQMVADLMAEQDIVKTQLDAAREGMLRLMARDGLRVVTAPLWTAEVKPTRSGRTTLRFNRKNK